MPEPKTRPYGSWRSPITSDLIVQDAINILDVWIDGQDVYWLEGRPREGGRYVLVRHAFDGLRADGRTADVNPAPFNARSRVHEYGGGSFTIAEGTAYFSNDKDQRLYRQAKNEDPEPLTPAVENSAAQLRYADGRIDRRRNRWVGVREDHSDPHYRGVDARNTIVAIDLAEGGPGEVLASGHDFVSSPRLSPDGQRLAWLAWNHPHMPWVGTELWMADLTPEGGLANRVRIAGGEAESIFQPEWSPEGELYFVSDRTNWWNLYRWREGRAEPLYPLDAEFGLPQWNFGMSAYAFVDARTIVCMFIQKGLEKLAVLDTAKGSLTPLDLPFTDFATIRAGPPGDLPGGLADTPAVSRSLGPFNGWLRRAAGGVDRGRPARNPAVLDERRDDRVRDVGRQVGLRPVLSPAQSRLSRPGG